MIPSLFSPKEIIKGNLYRKYTSQIRQKKFSNKNLKTCANNKIGQFEDYGFEPIPKLSQLIVDFSDHTNESSHATFHRKKVIIT